jgi:peptidyl-prolyl cis-trans isomerase A (cyclophilin A)
MVLKSLLVTILVSGISASQLRTSPSDAVALPNDGIDTSFGKSLLSDNQPSSQTPPPVSTDDARDVESDKVAEALEETKPADATTDATTDTRKCVDIDIKSDTVNGKIVAELDPAAPVSVKNFEHYVSTGFYKGTIFHRVISGFMVQCGGFEKNFYDGTTTEKTDGSPAIKNEASNDRPNLQGTLSMARTSDPDSATSQFFISLADNPSLDGDNQNGYAVFGKVIVGFDQVEEIGKMPTQTLGSFENVPSSPVEIVAINSIDCPPSV